MPAMTIGWISWRRIAFPMRTPICLRNISSSSAPIPSPRPWLSLGVPQGPMEEVVPLKLPARARRLFPLTMMPSGAVN